MVKPNRIRIVLLSLSALLAIWGLGPFGPVAQAAGPPPFLEPVGDCLPALDPCGSPDAATASASGQPLPHFDLITLNPSKDNTLFEDIGGTISSGIGPHLYVGRTNPAAGLKALRGLVAFNIAGTIPAGSTINSVTLQLNVSRIRGGNNVRLHRLSADWGEGSSAGGSPPPTLPRPWANATNNDATWIHRFFSGQFWATPGGEFNATPSAALFVNTLGSKQWLSTLNPQMVSDVQSWLDNPATNFGWMLKAEFETMGNAIRFDSKENAIVASRPQLIVNYTPPSIQLTKTVSDPTPGQGDFIQYTIQVKNNGPAAISGLTVRDPNTGGLTFQPPVTINPGSAGTVGAPPNIVTGLTVQPGQTVTINVNVQVNQNVNPGTVITNEAEVRSSGNTILDEDQVSITVLSDEPELSITKTASDTTPTVGSVLIYTIVIANEGNSPAANGVVTDTLPLTEVSFIGPVTINPPGAGIPGTPPTLATNLTVAAESNVTLSFPVQVSQDLISGTTFINEATIASPDIADPLSDSVTVTARRALPELVLTPVKDITLYEDAIGLLSNGAGQHLFVGNTNLVGGAEHRRALLAFDLTDGNIPASSTVADVTLKLQMSRTIPNSGDRLVTLHRVLADWGESSSVGFGQEGGGGPSATDDATWRHRFYPSVFWATAGGDFAPVVSASETVGDGGAYEWSSPQMVADVKNWIDNPATNFGWLLLGDESTHTTSKRFDSRQNSIPASRPQLIIELDLPPLFLVKKASNPTPKANETFTYTITVLNNSDNHAPNTVVSDSLPAGLTFVGPVQLKGASTAGVTLATSPGDLPTLASGVYITVGRTISLTFPVRVQPNVTAGTPIMNTATVTSSETPAPFAGSVSIVPTDVDFSISKLVDNSTPAPGDLVTFTIIVANDATGQEATDVVISDLLPAGLTFVGPVSLEPFTPGAKVADSADDLPVLASGVTIDTGQSVTLKFTARVNANVPEGSLIVNTARVNSAEVALPVSAQVTLAVGGRNTFLPMILKQ